MPRHLPVCDDCTPAPAVKVKPSKADEVLAGLAWAVAHPVRVRILRILLAKKGCVCGELVEMLPLAQSTVSQHLKVMKDAGLIQGEIDGPKVCYCVRPDGLEKVETTVGGL